VCGQFAECCTKKALFGANFPKKAFVLTDKHFTAPNLIQKLSAARHSRLSLSRQNGGSRIIQSQSQAYHFCGKESSLLYQQQVNKSTSHPTNHRKAPIFFIPFYSRYSQLPRFQRRGLNDVNWGRSRRIRPTPTHTQPLPHGTHLERQRLRAQVRWSPPEHSTGLNRPFRR
jgi:hypothetical protein